jgi:hypothetical protein
MAVRQFGTVNSSCGFQVTCFNRLFTGWLQQVVHAAANKTHVTVAKMSHCPQQADVSAYTRHSCIAWDAASWWRSSALCARMCKAAEVEAQIPDTKEVARCSRKEGANFRAVASSQGRIRPQSEGRRATLARATEGPNAGGRQLVRGRCRAACQGRVGPPSLLWLSAASRRHNTDSNEPQP